MEVSSSSMSTPASSSSSSTSEETKKKKKAKKLKKLKERQDKGRFDETPLKLVNTATQPLCEAEKKRKAEDDALAAVDGKKSKTKPRAKSESPSPRGNLFNDDETKALLLIIFKGQREDSKVAEEFFKCFPLSTRTKAAVKARVGRIREDLAKELTTITQTQIESSGLRFFTFVFSHIGRCE